MSPITMPPTLKPGDTNENLLHIEAMCRTELKKCVGQIETINKYFEQINDN